VPLASELYVPGHPLQTSIDVASLAPNAEITVYPWKEPEEPWGGRPRTIIRCVAVPDSEHRAELECGPDRSASGRGLQRQGQKRGLDVMC
jgi:hypothetical protein